MASRHAILQDLRQSVRAIDRRHDALCETGEKPRLSFGNEEIDCVLDGGLGPGDLHEVRHDFAAHAGVATGVLCALLARHAFLQAQDEDAPDFHKPDARKIVWITEPRIRLDSGGLYPDGLCRFGLSPRDFLLVQPAHFRDCLWAAGEAAGTSGFLAIVLQLAGHPKGFDLSASRQLLLRTQSGGAPLFVLRHSDRQEASSATTRWHVMPEPSFDDDFEPGIGPMRLGLSLEKNRNGPTGTWSIAWNRKTRSFDDATPNASATAHAPRLTHSRHPFPVSANRPHHPPPQTDGQVVTFARGPGQKGQVVKRRWLT